MSPENLRLDIASSWRPSLPRASIEIRIGDLWIIDARYAYLLPVLRPGFNDRVTVRQVLQEFRERFSTVECNSHLLRIRARELEEYVSAYCENRRTHPW